MAQVQASLPGFFESARFTFLTLETVAASVTNNSISFVFNCRLIGGAHYENLKKATSQACVHLKGVEEAFGSCCGASGAGPGSDEVPWERWGTLERKDRK